jgi:hypothetical protein
MIRLSGGGIERRRHARTAIVRSAKLRRRTGLKYTAGATVNASSSGLLLEVSGSAGLSPGDEVEVVVAWNDEPVLPKAGSVAGVVRRVGGSGPGGGSLVAVEFDRPTVTVASASPTHPGVSVRPGGGIGVAPTRAA